MKWGLDVSRLAELDIAWHGPQFILWEFGGGVVGPAALGLLSVRYTITHGLSLLSWPVLLGVELLAIALNYVPPLLVSALRAFSKTVQGYRSPIWGLLFIP